MSVFSVKQLVRRGVHGCVLLAFSAFALWPAPASVNKEGPYVLREPFAHDQSSQWYDVTQDRAPDRDNAGTDVRQAIDGYAARPVACLPLSAWAVTPGDADARDQVPFLTPYRGRAPPRLLFSQLG